ncbi:MAG: PQQ-binding-like beta-propeller repeat protein [Gemmataceae bacterium]
MSRAWCSLVLAAAAAATMVSPAQEPSWPMYGGSPARNMVNLIDRNVLGTIGAEKGPPRLWKAALGSRCYAQPVVAGGKVYVGTNNQVPRNPRDTRVRKDGKTEPIDKSILMCFEAATGRFLWQHVNDKLETGVVNDWPNEGVCSIPTVEGDRVFYVSNRCTVVCLDANGFSDGNQGVQDEKYRDPTDADVIWEFDMRKELGVFPHNMSSGCPLLVGDRLFVPTSNGVDEGHVNVPAPDAPNLIALDKRTGKLLWRDNAPGKDILHGQWASPAYAAEPVPQVIFPGGDGWLRAYTPDTGRLLWKFDCNPKGATYDFGGKGTKNHFIAAPVVADGRAYIGTGQDPEHFTGVGHLWCIDLKRAVAFGAANPGRDVSPVGNNFDPAAAANRMSALVWHYGGDEPRKDGPRAFKFGRTISTVAVVDGVVYAPELEGSVHCLDAATGELYWRHDTRGTIWASPYYVDGKVLVGTEDGDLFVYRHDPRPQKVDERAFLAATEKAIPLAARAYQQRVTDLYVRLRLEFDGEIKGTPAVAGGVLYIATEKALYAFKTPPA